MPPIFKNTEIQYKDLSSETKEQVKSNYKSKKLVGSMFGKKMLFPTELLKWYLEHGLIVSNITYAVRCIRKAPFQEFAKLLDDFQAFFVGTDQLDFLKLSCKVL